MIFGSSFYFPKYAVQNNDGCDYFDDSYRAQIKNYHIKEKSLVLHLFFIIYI